MADVTNTYYASDAFIGYGAEVLVGQGNASPETFTAIPEVNRITPGNMTTGVIPVTHLRSIGRHHEKRATIRDSGPIVLECNYIPTHGAHKQAGGDGFNSTHSVIKLWQTVAENNFRIVLPDAASTGGSPDTGEILDIRGTITNYTIGPLELEGKQSVTIEITPLQDYSTGLP